MSVSSEFGRRTADDELCTEVRQAVEGGDEDALRRLGFGGFGGYVQRLSEIMSDSVTDGLDPSADDFGAIMGEVASPARYAHHLVNEAGAAIQSAKDKPLGIHIKPAEPDFDDDALCSTVGNAASMDTPEQTVATLADGLGYAVKKAGNDFIKANAEQRSRAGFEVGVKRSGDSKCCEWCAARIGSWALKNAPDGVFGCHANCSCVVEYTSSTGAVSQRRGTGRFVEVEYQPPHVMRREEARKKGGFDEPKRLTERPSIITDMFDEYNNGQKDTIKFRNIEKELEKSPIGREIKQYLKENPCKINIFYNVNVPKDLYGEQDSINDTISIYASNTKTVARTAEILIHELTHRRFNIGGDFWSECVCKAQEYKHRYRRNDLTIAEKRAIIKEIKQVYSSNYPDWKWRNRR